MFSQALISWRTRGGGAVARLRLVMLIECLLSLYIVSRHLSSHSPAWAGVTYPGSELGGTLNMTRTEAIQAFCYGGPVHLLKLSFKILFVQFLPCFAQHVLSLHQGRHGGFGAPDTNNHLSSSQPLLTVFVL